MPLVMAVMVSRPRQECRQRVIKMMLVINNVLLPLLLERGQGYVSFITIPSRDVVIRNCNADNDKIVSTMVDFALFSCFLDYMEL